jgi:hypothetical protein
MIGINLKGGLGNMLFQIAAGISFAEERKTDIKILNLKNHLNYLNNDNTYNPNLKHSHEYFLINPFFILNNKKNKLINFINYYEYPFEYIDTIPEDNSIINGFFQSEKYFKKYRNKILEYFFPTDIIYKHLEKYNLSQPSFTSIHVRRGDYLNNTNLHPTQSIDYYLNAISILDEKTDKFFVFSDDINWCKLNLTNKKCFFIENEKDYIELYLMSFCQNHIISNSSFGWWGAWLSKNETKTVIAPNKWFGPDNYQYSDKDIIPENWVKL